VLAMSRERQVRRNSHDLRFMPSRYVPEHDESESHLGRILAKLRYLPHHGVVGWRCF
jgi:hypothetical protein